ncbi:MAG: hypothetical protein WDA27_02955 [Actinomycetota bacterium]
MNAETLGIAGAIYIARWPLQVLFFGVAFRRLRQHRKTEALSWAVAGGTAAMAPWIFILLRQPWPLALKVVILLPLAALFGFMMKRRLDRKLQEAGNHAAS